MDKAEFLSEYLVDRRGTNSMKWDGLEDKFGEKNLIPMWIADMEFRTCDEVIDAMILRTRHGIFGYSFVSDEYYQAFSKWMEKHFHFPVEKEWVRFTQGCVTALAWMIQAFTEKGDACMFLSPVYYPFPNVIINNDRTPVGVDLTYENGRFSMDFEAIERAIVEQNVKLFLQCSPHNPAGRVWTEAELDKVLAICKKHGVIVVSDEIHQDLVFVERGFVPAAMVCGGKYRDIVVSVSAASKTFNLATLSHAHIVIPDSKLRERYDKFASGMNRTEVNVVSLAATQAAYEHGKNWLECLKVVIQDNYWYVKEQFAEHAPAIRVCELEGTYLLFLDLRDYVNSEDIHEFIQNRCGLAVDYGEWFDEKYRGFIRVNLATDPELVKRMVSKIIFEKDKMNHR